MIDRLRTLSPEGRLVAGLVAAIAVVALALVGTSLGGADGPAQLETAASSSTTVRRSTTTTDDTTTTTTTAGGEATSTTAAAPGGPTTTAARGGVTPTTARPAATPTTKPVPAPTTTARPAPPPPSGSCTGAGGNAASNDLANRFCAHRSSSGKPLMVRTAALNQMAQQWAEKLAADHTLSHRSNADVRTMTLAACSRCTGWAENVAFAMDTASIWNGWLGSSSHRTNIDDGRAGEYGMGVAQSADGYLWAVQNFGRYP